MTVGHEEFVLLDVNLFLGRSLATVVLALVGGAACLASGLHIAHALGDIHLFDDYPLIAHARATR